MKLVVRFSWMFLVALLVGCQGGGDNGGDKSQKENYTPIQEGGGPHVAFLPYYDEKSIYLVDPENTDYRINIPSEGNQEITPVKGLYSYDLDFSTRKIKYVYRQDIIWIEGGGSVNNGKLFKASLKKENFPIKKRQISKADNICYIHDMETVVRDKVSVLVIVADTAGEDKKCNTSDDKQKYITSQMGENDIPYAFDGMKLVTSVQDYQNETVSMDNVLLMKDGSLIKCKFNNLDDCNYIISTDKEFKYYASGLIGANNTRSVYLCSGGDLFLYQDMSVQPVGNRVKCYGSEANYDDKAIYAVNQFSQVLKLNYGENKWQIIGQIDDSSLALKLITKNYVIVEGDKGEYAVYKDGGEVKPINGDSIYSYMNKVFYNTEKPKAACELDLDNMNSSCTGNTLWSGIAFSLNDSGADEQWEWAYKMIKTTNNEGEKSVSAYSVRTGETTFLGKLPAGAEEFFAIGFGKKILGLSNLNGSKRKQKDIFYIDVDKKNSLVRVTNTDEIDEYFTIF